MTYKEWFDGLELEGDIDSIHSVFCSVRDKEGYGGCEVKQVGATTIVSVPGTVDGEYVFSSQSEIDEFCNWLDERYGNGVEAEYVAWKANQRKD